MDMGIEFELKYRATPEIQEELAKTSQWHSISMETTYYDTPTKALSSRFFTLRRRLENGVSVCTLKAPAGELARGECETECDSIEEAISELCKLGCPPELPQLAAEGLPFPHGSIGGRSFSDLRAPGVPQRRLVGSPQLGQESLIVVS